MGVAHANGAAVLVTRTRTTPCVVCNLICGIQHQRSHNNMINTCTNRFWCNKHAKAKFDLPDLSICHV